MLHRPLRCRVGHLLAERKIQTAKLVAKAGMGAGACTLCVAVGLVYTNVARDFWTYLFTPGAQQSEVETETVAGMLTDIRAIWPLVMLFLVVDGLYALNGGLMRGLGLQGPSLNCERPQGLHVNTHCSLMRARGAGTGRNALATFVSLWMCGIPIIYWGVIGEWDPASVSIFLRSRCQFGCCICCELSYSHTLAGQGWGLEGLWMMLWPLYSVLCTLQFIGYTTKDWEVVSDRIIARLHARCEHAHRQRAI